MLYLAARQMWHDSTYQMSSNDSMLELRRVSMNILRQKPVMNETETRGPCDNSKKVLHMVMAGKVQNEIAKLPKHLQAFGNFCWSPKSEVMPTYSKQNEFMLQLVKEMKEALPELCARHTSKVSILIIQAIKYEREREQGRTQKAFDVVLANAMAMTKQVLRKQWGDAIAFVRPKVRDFINDQPPQDGLNHTIDKMLQTLIKREDSVEKVNQKVVLCKLAINNFAQRDKQLLFSAGEVNGAYDAAFKSQEYTKDYLAWRLGIPKQNWNRDWADTYNKILDMCEQMASKALKPIAELKAA